MLTNKNWNCSMAQVLDIVGGKWRMNILWVINKHNSIRFNELRREVEGITTISLTRGLEVLMDYGLVEKTDFETMPLHTEYQLTEKGQSLMPILRELNDWGNDIYWNLKIPSFCFRLLPPDFDHLAPKTVF